MGLTTGTDGRLGSGTPSNVWSRVLVCWSTAISETSYRHVYIYNIHVYTIYMYIKGGTHLDK